MICLSFKKFERVIYYMEKNVVLNNFDGDKMELVDLYNSKRENLNKTWERKSKIEPPIGEYKINVHTWLLNDKNELLIQKRGANLRRHPNKWNFTGGAVDTNESSYEGAKREVQEELGINIDNLELLISFRREHDFVDVWVAKINVDLDDLVLSEREVQEVRWVSLDALEELMKNGEFVPSLKLYYPLFKKLLEKCYINNEQ